MDFSDLVRLYEQKKSELGEDAPGHVSTILQDAKKLHKRDWLKHPTPQKDHGQSWRAFKGKNLEKLIVHIIEDQVKNLGLKIVEGNRLERSGILSGQLGALKKNLSINYGDFGFHLPDVDIVIFDPKNSRVIAVISSKVTLRERIAQTGYWKLRLSKEKTTKHIRVFFITPDEDGTLASPVKKGRAIVEADTDGAYIMSEKLVEESGKVKMFDKFIPDLRKLLQSS